MKIAIIHDWLVNPGGAEKVTKQLWDIYPEAQVFCLMNFLSPENKTKYLNNREVTTSVIQKLPLAKKYYRFLFPFFSNTISSLPTENFDLIISSSHSIAKGITTHPHQTHICYIHTPVRYAWDLRKQYLQQIGNYFLRFFLRKQLLKLQQWDLENSSGVDHFIANSKNVADRVSKNYGRESTVIYPPVDTEFFDLPTESSETSHPYFMVVSRLVLYKRIDVIVKAFNQMPNLKLVIAGEGPQKRMLEKLAAPNIEFIGFQSDLEIKKLFQNSRAAIFAANEDFGITPVEAQACGTPVIALKRGGYLETVSTPDSGILFANQTASSLVEGLTEFIKLESTFQPEKIRENILKFGTQRFKAEIKSFIDDKLATGEK